MAKIRITGIDNVDYVILALTIILAMATTHLTRRSIEHAAVEGLQPA
jgi:hypothetical protein